MNRDTNLTPLTCPQFVDGNGLFDISREFLVSERLDSLAYFMASAAPYWKQSSDPPTVSKSHSTDTLVMTNCTAKRLLGPSEDCIQEFLNISIDFRPNSPLRQALTGTSNTLVYFRNCLISTSMPPQINPFPDSCEDDYFNIVAGSLRALLPLAALCILQLWIRDGNDVDTEAFDIVVQILIRLEVTQVARDAKCKPDHAVGGPENEITKYSMSHGAFYAFAMIDRKSKAFVEYVYLERRGHLFNIPGFASLTKDGLIEDIISDGRGFRDIRETFIGKGAGNYSGGWRVQTLHLLGQMKTQYMKSGSKMAHFTSLYAFNRVALVEDNQLYITKNLTANLGGQQGSLAINRLYQQIVLLFLITSISKAYPETIPPQRLMAFQSIFTPELKLPKISAMNRLPVVLEDTTLATSV